MDWLYRISVDFFYGADKTEVAANERLQRGICGASSTSSCEVARPNQEPIGSQQVADREPFAEQSHAACVMKPSAAAPKNFPTVEGRCLTRAYARKRDGEGGEDVTAAAASPNRSAP